jgi:5-methylcytosine-specific restriction endonuclease McrBC GTP-binding regulatory subunit McrB
MGHQGVGKTHNTNKLINLIENGYNENEIFKSIKENKKDDTTLNDDIKSRTKFITFHQSFGYENFIEGFRPNKNGNIALEDGIFKKICEESKNKNKPYYLIIDEINRGNISKIFGEIITLIEESKRDNLEVTLPYSQILFKIPSNLYIIGTMNSTDKSIALIDIALRRRFTFLKMQPNAELIANENAKKILQELNKQITKDLGDDYIIGHSYFMGITNDDNNSLEFVLDYKIKPLLEEYYYGDDERLKSILEIIDNLNF